MLGLKRFVSICLTLVFASKAQTQISMPYTMGVVGNAGQPENIFSGSILFDSQRCFYLSNGVSNILNGTSNLFSINCIVSPSLEQLDINAFPNPFSEKVIIKSQSRFNFSTSVMYDLLLFDGSGKLIKKYTTSIYALRSGFEMIDQFQKSGIYFLKVQVGQMHIETLKLIKIE